MKSINYLTLFAAVIVCGLVINEVSESQSPVRNSVREVALPPVQSMSIDSQEHAHPYRPGMSQACLEHIAKYHQANGTPIVSPRLVVGRLPVEVTTTSQGVDVPAKPLTMGLADNVEKLEVLDARLKTKADVYREAIKRVRDDLPIFGNFRDRLRMTLFLNRADDAAVLKVSEKMESIEGFPQLAFGDGSLIPVLEQLLELILKFLPIFLKFF